MCPTAEPLMLSLSLEGATSGHRDGVPRPLRKTGLGLQRAFRIHRSDREGLETTTACSDPGATPRIHPRRRQSTLSSMSCSALTHPAIEQPPTLPAVFLANFDSCSMISVARVTLSERTDGRLYRWMDGWRGDWIPSIGEYFDRILLSLRRCAF
ncbi:hypothetical protein DFP72DRAFT_454527 [Ephemerocybe angulata]|uniref:Uncharacterized protein n=1 Tax=Ephemerocybe angulata TaxID=980116 RepID=A0A8H6M2W5_9AGAR|nr:hypothetical protein DFP72DRAFT_58787 [Tulosesus angulatus]KAF6752510.1 hypothetical protein DFP72DRAFT_454527 [Tulosesus angulatus]